MNDNYIDITIVLDRSGSMGSIRSDMEGGLNDLIKTQKEVQKDVRVSLYQFDNLVEKVFEEIPVSDVGKITLTPRNMTALYDAVGRAISETGERLANKEERERPGKVLFVIITDGLENASHEYTQQMILDTVKHQETHYKWDFMYLGANQDAFAVGQGLGIKGDNVLQYNSTQIGTQTMSSVRNRALRAYSQSGVSGQSIFSAKDRKEVAEAK